MPTKRPRCYSWVGKIPLEKEMTTHSSILTWRIPWTEEPSRLQSMGWLRVGHDLVTKQQQGSGYIQVYKHWSKLTQLTHKWVHFIASKSYSIKWTFKNVSRDFPSGPMTKPLHSQYRGPGFFFFLIPGQGTRSHIQQLKSLHPSTKDSACHN